MPQISIPQLVVFDLDFTLWDAGGVWCDCTTPPYHFDANRRLIDRRGRHIRLYDDVLPILERLNELDIPVALASRTEQPTWADQLTRLLRIDSLVQYREIYPGSKIEHLRRIENTSGVSCSDMTFFDDEYRNIKETQQIGVHAVLVSSGISAEIFTKETGIEL